MHTRSHGHTSAALRQIAKEYWNEEREKHTHKEIEHQQLWIKRDKAATKNYLQAALTSTVYIFIHGISYARIRKSW